MGRNILLVSGGEYGDLYSRALRSALNDCKTGFAAECARPAGARALIEAWPGGGRADCLVISDWKAPDIHLLKKAKAGGSKIILYGWAGTTGHRRLKKLAELVDMALAFSPHETTLFRNYGVGVEFIGHPLVDIIDTSMGRREAKSALGYDWTEVCVTLVSSGKGHEAEALLRLMVEGAAEAAVVSFLKVRLIIPDREKYDEGFLSELKEASPKRIKFFEKARHTALLASEAAVVAARPTTVEAALAGAHMLTVKKTSCLSYFLESLGNGERFISIPNIILERALFPELRQKEVTAKRITEEVMGLIEGAEKEEMNHGLAVVRENLGPPGTVKRAASAISRALEA